MSSFYINTHNENGIVSHLILTHPDEKTFDMAKYINEQTAKHGVVSVYIGWNGCNTNNPSYEVEKND